MENVEFTVRGRIDRVLPDLTDKIYQRCATAMEVLVVYRRIHRSPGIMSWKAFWLSVL